MAQRWPVVTFAVTVLVLCGLIFAARLPRETTPFALVLAIPAAAVLSAWLSGSSPMVRGLFERITRWRVAPAWYALAIGIPLLGTLAIDAAGIATGQATLPAVVSALGTSALIVPLVVLLPALLEEFAWRGHGVDVMLRRGSSAAVAALVIALPFLAVHLPLYLPGQLYDGLPLWPAIPTTLGYAVLLTWIYVGSGHSSLVAGISHAALNGFVPLTVGIEEVWVWEARGVVFGLIGLAILAVLALRPSREEALAPA
jgi:hypothetical protein